MLVQLSTKSSAFYSTPPLAFKTNSLTDVIYEPSEDKTNSVLKLLEKHWITTCKKSTRIFISSRHFHGSGAMFP